ncbi:serine-rich 25 kDa antigen protein-like [Alosa sapidissima]|uniref:serine-rich 25 kDa antigen protein-like n=1 Tax=Alosa sapidissima TaxID=34773 RepID=UPI001C088174|nr:serine-rich 25 kDa antigen protein-like [Alosa sapidissima]
MTQTSKATFCPLCQKLYSAFNQHLERGHKIKNKTERDILNKMGNGRIKIRTESCTVPGCPYKGSRLDKHLDNGHKELSAQERAAFIKEAKLAKGKASLAELRASNPQVPMVSTLDIDVTEGDDMGVRPDEEDEEEEDTCPQCSETKRQLKDLTLEVKTLKAQNNTLTRELATSRRKNRLLIRRLGKIKGEQPMESTSSDESDEAMEPEPEPEPEPGPSGISKPAKPKSSESSRPKSSESSRPKSSESSKPESSESSKPESSESSKPESSESAKPESSGSRPSTSGSAEEPQDYQKNKVPRFDGRLPERVSRLSSGGGQHRQVPGDGLVQGVAGAVFSLFYDPQKI